MTVQPILLCHAGRRDLAHSAVPGNHGVSFQLPPGQKYLIVLSSVSYAYILPELLHHLCAPFRRRLNSARLIPWEKVLTPGMLVFSFPHSFLEAQ